MQVIQDRQFEQGILRFIGIVGLLRMVYALYINVVWENPLFFWIMDCSLLAVFLLLVVLSFYVDKIEWLTMPFSIILWIMTSISFINTGGIYGMSEYNLLAIVIIMAMIHNGKTMIGFVMLVLVSLMALTISWEYELTFLSWFDQIPTTGLMNYLLIVLLGTVALSYMMLRSGEEETRLKTKQAEMELRIEEIAGENDRLERQKAELNRVNDWLENRISERSKDLKSSNKSLEDFLNVSVQEFRPSIRSTVDSIEKLKNDHPDDPIVELLGNSAEKLLSGFDVVKRKIKSYHSNNGRGDD